MEIKNVHELENYLPNENLFNLPGVSKIGVLAPLPEMKNLETLIC